MKPGQLFSFMNPLALDIHHVGLPHGLPHHLHCGPVLAHQVVYPAPLRELWVCRPERLHAHQQLLVHGGHAHAAGVGSQSKVNR